MMHPLDEDKFNQAEELESFDCLTKELVNTSSKKAKEDRNVFNE